jgi:hypothetical protein
MSNIFIKTDGPENCYLIASKVFEKKILDDDSLSIWNDHLNDPEAPDDQKFLIINFLLPYKISVLKFLLNKDYWEDPFPVDFTNNHKHIAPSLKKIKESRYDIALGYPDWFFVAFPDVAFWAMKGPGKSLIMSKFKNYPEEKLSDGNYLRPNLLNEIIKMYLNNTGNPLECKKY